MGPERSGLVFFGLRLGGALDQASRTPLSTAALP
jgi:hypothetical protein